MNTVKPSFSAAAIGVLLGVACFAAVESHAQQAASDAAVMARWPGHRLFEDFSARTQISPDGRWILRTSVDGDQDLLSVATSKPDPQVLHGGLDGFERAVFCGKAGFLRLGSRAKEHGWFGPGTALDAGPMATIPAEATPVCSPDAAVIAHYTSYPPRRELPPPTEIFVGTARAQSAVKLGGVPTGAVFSLDGGKLYVIARQEGGASSLLEVSSKTRTAAVLAADLDAWPFTGVNVALSPDGREVVVALATLGKPDDARRQKPAANRWLKLAAFDLRQRKLRYIQVSEGHDETDPAVVGNDLYWVHIDVKKDVMAVPTAGGAPHSVVSGIEAYAPSWSRDGKRIAYVLGEYRLVDWALSQDVGIVDVVDAVRKPATSPRIFIRGNHEDFPPDWSPNGRWIVWHSHRDPNKDAAFYDAPGTTDDIWMRRAEDLNAKEIRVTDNLWETGWVYWSADGRKIIYTTWDRNAEPGTYHVWTTAIDQDTGVIGKAEEIHFPPTVHSPQIAVFSPDGKEIALEDASAPGQRILWAASADGKKVEKIAAYESETYGGVDWTPDGKTLLFAGLDGQRMQIFSIPRSGGTPRRLTDGKGNLIGPRVSPDGKWTAYSRVDTVQTLLRRPY